MTKFRPCIDLHAGSVKQIVGGTLSDTLNDPNLKTNYVSEKPASYYADLYKENELLGSHVIMLGPGNDTAAKEACESWPGKLQVGGGINDSNAGEWIARGAGQVRVILSELHQISIICLSYVFSSPVMKSSFPTAFLGRAYSREVKRC